MLGMTKSLIAAIITLSIIIIISSLLAAFPFYLTMVTEAFNLANIASGDNYVKQLYYDEALDNLKGRPVFNKVEDSVIIEIKNIDGRDAIGNNDEFYYNERADKPYRQRGNSISIKVSADYPFDFTLLGETRRVIWPMSFSITTIGLKYYKDLDWNSDLY